MQGRTKGAGPAAALAVLAMLLLPGLPAAGAGTVDRFSDGSSEATFYFGEGPGSNRTTFTLSRKAVLGSAGLYIEGLPGGEGEYPSGASLRLGSETVWDFGLAGPGSGEMGRQREFYGGRGNLSFTLPPGGGGASGPGLILPSDAVVKEASLEISAAAGPLAPRLFSSASAKGWVFWNPVDGTVVQAAQAGDALEFTARDPFTGEHRGPGGVRLSLPGGSFVADVQFWPGSGQAAVLLPGRGVQVVNLTNGQEQMYFTGADAASLEAMSFSGATLTVLGRGWAAVRHQVGGAVDRVDSAEFPEAPWSGPVAVDYEPGGRRLVMASRGAMFPYKAVSVFRLEDRTVRVFSDTSVTSSLASMALVPGKDCVVLGMGGVGSVNGRTNNHAAVAMSLQDGAVSYITAFEGLDTVLSLRRQGGLVCAIGDPAYESGPALVLLDASDWSWRTFSGAGTGWSGAPSWAYDPDGARLFTRPLRGGLEVYELDFALMAGRMWQLPDGGPSVPGDVTAVLAQGDGLIAGTGNGLAAIGPGGGIDWTVDCGRVDALARDPVTGRVVAAGLGALRCGPGWGLWDRRELNLPDLDVSGPAPRNLGRTVALPGDWFYTRIEGIAPCARNNSRFLSVSAYNAYYNANGLYELRANGTFSRIQTPSTSVGALAISPDGRTLYAACDRAGLLVLDIATGAQELLSPFSEAPLLSPNIASIAVDESGGVLVAQTPSYGYFPGGVSLLWRSANGTMETLRNVELDDLYAYCAARDRAGGRIFVASGDLLAVINESDGARSDIRPGASLYSVEWSAPGGFLAGAGAGAAVRLDWAAGPPSDLSLDIGADGTVDWSAGGAPRGAARVDIATALAGRLASSRAGQRFTEVPVRVGAGSAGVVRLASLSVVYGLRERVDLGEALARHLAALPDSEQAVVALDLSATGGGLRLSGLNLTFAEGAAPRPRAMPEVRLDAGAGAPTILDLSRYFTDDLSAPGNLTYAISAPGRPGGVAISLLFGHYVLLDARQAAFRGGIRVSVTATDGQGLSATAELRVSVFRSGEYIPPPAYYGTLAWAFGAVVLVLGLVALRLYLGAFRKRE